MNAIGKHLAKNLSVSFQTQVAKIVQTKDGISVSDDAGTQLGIFDRVIVSAPAEQSAVLLESFPKIAKQVAQVEMNPCWALMVALPEPVSNQWVGAFLHDSFLSWAARNSTKPGRNSGGDGAGENLVIHAKPEWTAEHWDCDSDEVAHWMLDEFWRLSGAIAQTPNHLVAHRWKYAFAVNPSDCCCFMNDAGTVVVCGDWANGSRVEGAFLSGVAAANRILGESL